MMLSVNGSLLIKERTNDTMADIIKMIIIASLNSFKNFFNLDFFFDSLIVFLPSLFNLFKASLFESPFSLVFSFFNASFIFKL